MQESALLLIMLHYLIKYLAISINHNRAASTLQYTDFPNMMKYYSRSYFVMMKNYTMPSGHSMDI